MHTEFYPRLLAIMSLALLAAVIACSGEPAEGGDAGIDADGPLPDADLHDVDDVATDAPTPPAEAEYCEPCSVHEDCVDDGAHCIEMIDGISYCGAPCEIDGDDCNEDAVCAPVGEDETPQCVPTILTCADHCQDVECPAGEYCDPASGACEMQPRICETGCQFDSQCGDPGENRCLGTGAPDGETMCTITCDPTLPAEEAGLECPTDFFCVPLEEGAEEGVCFPLTGTCVDRCHDADCPAGHNCDEFTGDCVEAIAGACDDTCETNAECDGQTDLCLAIGIGDGAHCWQDCTGDQSCPDGYDCTAFLGLTTNLCVPAAQQCEECYDADCFPDGVCDPTTGECTPHPEDCLVEGCDDNQLCEPVSRRCVDLDRSCSGDSWAVDCDNVVTRCTSQRSDTDGICATICTDDNDCHGDRGCTSTIHGDLCLKPELGGSKSCGVIAEENAPIGEPCGDGVFGSCGIEKHCVETGGLPGFCSHDCDDDADCPDGATCGIGPDGASICFPAQCRCAPDPVLSPALDDAWNDALDEAGITVCDLEIPASAVDAFGDFGAAHFHDDSFAPVVSHPAAAMGTLRTYLEALDDADGAIERFAHAPSLLGITGLDTDTSADTPIDLADAIAAFSETAGGNADPSEFDEVLEDIPSPIQELASQIVVAIDDAYQARLDAFDAAGLDDTTLQTLFDETHRLFLPHADNQDALDLDDPDLAEAAEEFPVDELAQISVKLAAEIDGAIADAELDLEAFDDDEFFAIIDTPAGAIVIADGTNNVYDADEDDDLDGPTALILDIGGDNEYRIPVAANQSVDNGISILVDLDGDDTYSYPKTGDALDGDRLLVSDDAGRKIPGDSDDSNGAVSLSETARQGAGRLGIGMLFDLGGANSYETLRLGQGAAILGVGALFDLGEETSSFDAEAFAQGAGFRGVGMLYSAGGDNSYRLWHAGQGFGTAFGLGILYDRQGDDIYTAVTGTEDDEDVIYHSTTDSGAANASLAQGATAPSMDAVAGIGILRDHSGSDSYEAGSYAQGFGESRGIGALADADGDDIYEARNNSHGTGRDAGAGLLLDTGGDDEFSQVALPPERGQGSGDDLGWGALIVEGGENSIDYNILGGGLAYDGGMGFALFDGGPNTHEVIGGGFGLATFNADTDSPQANAMTAGFFLQAGGAVDSYEHPSESLEIEDDSVWRQDDDGVDHAIGVGIDQ